MNIGFDFRMGGVAHGGIGRYSFELLKNLLAYSTSDNFYIFLNTKTQSKEEISELSGYKNAIIIEANFRHYSLEEQLYFPSLIKKYGIHLMHFPNFNVPIRYKEPYVVTIHDMTHHKISGHKRKNLLYFYGYKYVIETAVKKSKKIITVSESSKRDIQQIFSIDDDKIRVTYEGVNCTLVTQDKVDKIRSNLLLSRPYFLFVGVLERKKNIQKLTEAFDLFIEKYGLDIDLVIAGKEDPHYPEIKSNALSVKNRHRIVFTGFVSNEELSALYQGAYAFVTTSLHEGFGLPGLEAMARSVPVIASNTDTFNEIYDDGALFCDPLDIEDIASKMHLLARDPQFYEVRQKKSLARASFFSWQETAKATYKVYMESLN